MSDETAMERLSAAAATAIAAATEEVSTFVEAGMLVSLPGTPGSILISLSELSGVDLFLTFLRALL